MKDLSKMRWFLLWPMFLILVSLSILIICSKGPSNFDAPVLGVISLTVMTLIIIIVQPNYISTDLFTIEKKVDQIQENLRPYAILNSGKVIYSTFEENELGQAYVENIEDMHTIVAIFNKEPKHIEFRNADGSAYSIKKIKFENQWQYEAKMSAGYKNPDFTCIIEAYFMKV